MEDRGNSASVRAKTAERLAEQLNRVGVTARPYYPPFKPSDVAEVVVSEESARDIIGMLGGGGTGSLPRHLTADQMTEIITGAAVLLQTADPGRLSATQAEAIEYAVGVVRGREAAQAFGERLAEFQAMFREDAQEFMRNVWNASLGYGGGAARPWVLFTLAVELDGRASAWSALIRYLKERQGYNDRHAVEKANELLDLSRKEAARA